ncbi:hypothetical protein EYF80_046073 [Liparis tanakae]|uniref:Uncharacterized protein n=1 Tax=Liparis tanakae TaxID=230148 RepID=A0A4Z2FRE4_9TELE|nr:hypothetical protein EYF80_046073 [Liparis tanakae]
MAATSCFSEETLSSSCSEKSLSRRFCYLKVDVGSSEAFLLARSRTPALQTDTHTYAGPVSAQALQLTPDRGHAVRRVDALQLLHVLLKSPR